MSSDLSKKVQSTKLLHTELLVEVIYTPDEVVLGLWRQVMLNAVSWVSPLLIHSLVLISRCLISQYLPTSCSVPTLSQHVVTSGSKEPTN